ncbi:MAG: hypothetical protein K9G60_11940 [Pseudolabrys sp.]|nr:hypothetical protein [Pseudolabrys sp.]
MPTAPLIFHFKDDGAVPNHPAWPMLVYKAALDLKDSRDPEDEIEKLFAENGWGHGQWRNGIYPFAHYHSKIHEVLGMARGHATVRFGGDKGEVLDLAPGDVAVLPAGIGHQRLSASGDLVVIGGYPGEGTYNLCRGDNPADRQAALKTIADVPKPAGDPVAGRDGPLLALWTSS